MISTTERRASATACRMSISSRFSTHHHLLLKVRVRPFVVEPGLFPGLPLDRRAGVEPGLSPGLPLDWRAG